MAPISTGANKFKKVKFWNTVYSIITL
jgi:hypothetical protein